MEVIHQIVLEIQTNDNVNITERRFPSTIPISDLKCRLELITGASAATMKLTFKDTNGQLIGEGFDSKTLGDYHLPGGEQRLRLLVTDSEANRFADVSSVPKFELSEEEYAKRTDSVRAFKMRHKLGQFGDKPEEPIKVDHIKVGDRCEVTVKNGPARRGQVKYVGKLGDKAGLFVGICCDEPNGKNDGSFEGVRLVLPSCLVIFLTQIH